MFSNEMVSNHAIEAKIDFFRNQNFLFVFAEIVYKFSFDLEPSIKIR